MKITTRAGLSVCLALAIAAATFAQQEATGGLLTGSPVQDVPLSAIATTTVQQTLSDGARVERTGTAHYYRDRIGRVRVEQLAATKSATNDQIRITTVRIWRAGQS